MANPTRVNRKLRKFVNHFNRLRLKNKDFSLISSDCNGPFILHDLGMKFNSPTVNLYFMLDDYIKFLQNLDHYLSQKLIFSDELEAEKGFPVAFLDDIKIFFMHYNSREEAESKWMERAARVNKENLFVMMTFKDSTREDILKEFEALPYSHKVVFTKNKYKEYPSTCRLKHCIKNGELGFAYEFTGPLSPFKYFDQFNYVGWFNKNA